MLHTIVRSLPVVMLATTFTGVASTHAQVQTFTETFADGPANWFDPTGAAPLTWEADGGADGPGDGYVTTPFAFSEVPPLGSILARGQDEFNSSDNAFVGDWIDSQIEVFTFSIRHDAPAPVDVFVRFAQPDNSPGAIGISFAPIVPNTWTEVAIPIDPNSPNLINFGGSDFDTIFSDIGHIQIGINAPDGFENDPTLYNFDFDSIGVVAIPAPGVLGLAACLPLATGRRRRRG